MSDIATRDPDPDPANDAAPTIRFAAITMKRQIGIRLAIVARLLRQRFDQRVEEMGVTRAKWMLIGVTATHPGATQRFIASKLEVTDVTAGRLIDRLCADGLIERRSDPQDRRSNRIFLTGAAEPLIAQMAMAADEYEQEVFTSLSDEELRVLNHALGILSDNLAKYRHEPGELESDVL